MDTKVFHRVGIVLSNHTAYLETMFKCMEAGNIAVPLRGNDDRDHISAASVEQIIII